MSKTSRGMWMVKSRCQSSQAPVVLPRFCDWPPKAQSRSGKVGPASRRTAAARRLFGVPASAGGVSLMKPDEIFNRADPHQPLPAKAYGFRKFGEGCPGGTNENSPAFQRRDEANPRRSPEGTAEIMSRMSGIRPSLRDSKPPDTFPGVSTPGYFREVPPGLPCAAKTLNFRKALG